MDVGPIDIVYTWVDGDDVELARSLGTVSGEAEAVRHRLAGQWRELGELRYSLRSVHRFMPWVRRIYVVTNGQKPGYLRFDSDRIVLVTHDEIFPVRTDLPVFNSLAIECHLHRIGGLSEYFVYFNNDFFVGRPVTREDFVDGGGRERFFLEYPAVPCAATEHEHVRLLNHNNLLVDRVVGPGRRWNPSHTPQVYRRDVCDAVWDVWKPELEQTSASRFRTADVCFFRYLYTYHSIARAYPGRGMAELVDRPDTNVRFARRTDCVRGELSSDREASLATFKVIEDHDPTFFCIQDHLWEAFDDGRRLIASFLRGRLPEAAPWEVADLPER